MPRKPANPTPLEDTGGNVDACFATQLQDVSDLLDWWLAQRHLQRAVDELRIMRSRGNIYFV